jgi:acetyl esterase/lipase
MFSPDEVVLDAELGFLLCSISHAGPRVFVREELRDVITAVSGAPGDFQPDLPPGMPVVEEEPDHDAPPGPVNVPRALAGAFARKAAKDAQSAVQGFVDFIRGGDARLPQDDADDLVESTGLTVKAAIALTGGPRRRHRLRTIMCGELQGTTGANMDLDRRLDPEIAAALAELPIMDLSDIPAARETMLERRAVAAADAQPSPTVVRQDHLVPGLNGAPDVRVRHYRPIRAPGALPCLYWIHGGGHVLGQMDQDDLVMDHIVDSVGCAAVSVEWRRAPEHPFPAPMDDCYAGLAWTHKHAAELNVDPQRIAVGGASSGGGSAAGLVLLARDRGEFPVCFQLLIYPMLDDRNATPASMALTDPRVWNRTSNLIGWRAYVGDAAGTDRVSPYAAPARAANLAGLPPAYLAVGDLDLFIDEDIEYAQRLQQADVPTELHVYPGGSHAFESYAPGSALARRFVRDRDEALRRAFGF